MRKKMLRLLFAFTVLGAIAVSPSAAVGVEKVQAAEAIAFENGTYQVEITMEGGSGRASIQSPAKLEIQDGTAIVTIVWSSANYDYMIVDGMRYEAMIEDGHSTFEIPVTVFDEKVSVIGDTVAMSQPHEIEYTLYFDSSTVCEYGDSAEIPGTDNKDSGVSPEGNEEEFLLNDEKQTLEQVATEIEGLVHESCMELQYANQFAVDYYEGGYKLLTIANTGRFLLIPEGMQIPESLDEDIISLEEPIENIYLVATSAMDFFDKLDAMSMVRLSGTNADGWYIENAKKAMENGHILYAGKYSAPDYENILSQNCGLAIESTMIYHSPDVKEKLEKLGVPVMIERSSYESHPLGRMEWIKFYGALTGHEKNAEAFYQEQLDLFSQIAQSESTGKTVAFFYINSAGTVNVRKSGDYVAKMIELSGGRYVFDQLSEQDDALSTMNITLEDFYIGAKDADCLIYNSTIDGEMGSISELLTKSPLLADFKAVKEGNVWCTQKSLFQESTGLAVMMSDMHQMLTTEEKIDNLTYLYRLQ